MNELVKKYYNRTFYVAMTLFILLILVYVLGFFFLPEGNPSHKMNPISLLHDYVIQDPGNISYVIYAFIVIFSTISFFLDIIRRKNRGE